MAMTDEEKALASVAKRIKTLEDRISAYTEFTERLTAEGRDYIARKVMTELRAYDTAGYYADIADRFITVLETHKVTATPELIMKVLECASYTKWQTERQAGELAREEMKRR